MSVVMDDAGTKRDVNSQTSILYPYMLPMKFEWVVFSLFLRPWNSENRWLTPLVSTRLPLPEQKKRRSIESPKGLQEQQ